MSQIISTDGEKWYECPDDQFADFFRDEGVDLWVDLSTPGNLLHVRLSAMRQLAELNKKDMPKILYGVPVEYESCAEVPEPTTVFRHERDQL